MSSGNLSDSFHYVRTKAGYKARLEKEELIAADESQMNSLQDQGYEASIKDSVAEQLLNAIQPRADFEAAFDDFQAFFESKTPTMTVDVRTVMEQIAKLKERLRLK